MIIVVDGRVGEFDRDDRSVGTLNHCVDIFRNKEPKSHIVFLPNCLSISSSEGIDTITKWIKSAEDAIDRIETSII